MQKRNIPKYALTFINVLYDMDKRDRRILMERFVQRRTLEKVASGMKVSPQRVKFLEDRIIDDINNRFKLLNL